MTIDVAMLQDVRANEGSDSVAVVDYAKMWTFAGHFLAAGDKVREILARIQANEPPGSNM